MDHLRTVARLHALDAAAAARKVAHDVAQVLFGDDDLVFHHRLQQHRTGLGHTPSLKAMEPAILNAISEESTSCELPSTSVARKSITS